MTIRGEIQLLAAAMAESNRMQQAVAAARVQGAATVVATANPAYCLGLMFDADTAGLVTVRNGATVIQIIPAGTLGGQMIPLFGVKCTTNITVVLAGADLGTVFFVPVS